MQFAQLLYTGKNAFLQRRKITKRGGEAPHEMTEAEALRTRIIKRAALEFHDGMYGIF